MSSNESDSRFTPRIPLEILALKSRNPPLSQSQSNSVSLENVEEILSLIDFELLGTIHSGTILHTGDRAASTINRWTRWVGSGASFTVWRFASGRSRIEATHGRLVEKVSNSAAIALLRRVYSEAAYHRL